MLKSNRIPNDHVEESPSVPPSQAKFTVLKGERVCSSLKEELDHQVSECNSSLEEKIM